MGSLMDGSFCSLGRGEMGVKARAVVVHSILVVWMAMPKAAVSRPVARPQGRTRRFNRRPALKAVPAPDSHCRGRRPGDGWNTDRRPSSETATPMEGVEESSGRRRQQPTSISVRKRASPCTSSSAQSPQSSHTSPPPDPPDPP